MNTNKHETPRTIENSSDQQTDESWDTALSIVTELRNEQPETHSISSLEYAWELIESMDSRLSSAEGELMDEHLKSQVRLITCAPYTLHVQESLRQYDARRKTERLPEEEWNDYNNLKEYTVWYNQQLSGYMYEYDKESFSALSQAITETAFDFFPDDIDATERNMKALLRGARYEANALHVFETANIPCRTATIKDDIDGADIVVIENDTKIKVDIKASLDQVAGAAGGYEGHFHAIVPANGKKSAKILLFPAFSETQLGDSMRLAQDLEQACSQQVAISMFTAIHELKS